MLLMAGDQEAAEEGAQWIRRGVVVFSSRQTLSGNGARRAVVVHCAHQTNRRRDTTRSEWLAGNVGGNSELHATDLCRTSCLPNTLTARRV